MSIFNDYLTKIGKDGYSYDKKKDVPPIFKRKAKKKKTGRIYLTSFSVIAISALALYFHFGYISEPVISESAKPVIYVSKIRYIPKQNNQIEKKEIEKKAQLLDPEKIIAALENTSVKQQPPEHEAIKPKPEPDFSQPEVKSLEKAEIHYQKPEIRKVEPGPQKIEKEIQKVEPEPRKIEGEVQKVEPETQYPELKIGNTIISVRTKFVEENLSKDIKDINYYYQTALLAQNEKHYRKAEKFYLRVLEKKTDHIDALTNLSAVYIHQKRFPDAEQILAKIYKINPVNIRALVNSGIIDIYFKRYEKAKNHFQEALIINPYDESALINLAYLAQIENNAELTEKYYKQLLEVSPDNYEVLLNYASLMEKNSRFDEAIALYQRSLKHDSVKINEQLFKQINTRIKILRYYKFDIEN
ncbi:hypothetical protein GMMP15_740029 [Candidatus Magnetomoraceae bacterium gMMP-15]